MPSRKLFMMMVVAILVLIIFKQNTLVDVEHYVSEDGDFSFDYPQTWNVSLTSSSNVMDAGKFFTPLDQTYLEITFPVQKSQYEISGFGKDIREINHNYVKLWWQIMSGIAQIDVNSQAPVLSESGSEEDKQYIYSIVKALDSENVINSYVFSSVIFEDRYISNFVISSRKKTISLNKLAFASKSIISSMKYRPPEKTTGDAALPNTFSQEIGQLYKGVFTFHYPSDWYAAYADYIILQNKPEPLDPLNLKSGDLHAFITPPDLNALLLFDKTRIASCRLNSSVINREMVISALSSQIQANMQDIQPGSPTIVDQEQQISELHLATRTFDITLFVRDMGGGNIISLMVITPAGEWQRYQDILLSIVESFEYEPETCVASTG